MNDRYKLDLFISEEKNIGTPFPVQEITDDLYTHENIRICLLAMDLPGKSLKYRKELENRWIKLLPKLIHIKSISLRIRVGQPFFESVCEMQNLEHLHFWTSKVENIGSIANLMRLERLDLDNFSQLQDISPLRKLANLTRLSITSCFKIQNYDIIGDMHNLIALRIRGDSAAPKNLILPSIFPFRTLNKLKHLDLSSTSILDKSYLTILDLKNLERFDTQANIAKELRDKMLTHKKLKAGFFTDWDWDNKKILPGKNWAV